MNQNEKYEVWKNGRKDIDVDAGFADRVMEQIVASQPRLRDGVRSSNRDQPINGHRVWGIPTVSALLLVSLTVGLLRYGSVLVFLSLMSSTGY
ncbi:MAG: hypothetical protein JXM70_25725 [Pirellulales bacterium]|nr:hypothetical protein [Pirellulales bacterium]